MGHAEGEGSTPAYRRRGTPRSPLRLSPTGIAIFQRCPQEYKFRYIDKLGEQYLRPRPYFTTGNHIHAALKDLLSAPEGERTPARAERLLLEHWGSSSLGFRDARDEQHWQTRALAQVTAFAQSSYAQGAPLMLEASLEAMVSPEVILYGRVDRADLEADGSLRIIDYKTGKMPPSVDWRPVELYALLLSMADSPQVGHLCVLYLDTCSPLSREVSSLDMERVRWELLGVALKIQQEKRYPPRPGTWCRNCDFASLCPARTPGETRAGLLGQLHLWQEGPDDIGTGFPSSINADGMGSHRGVNMPVDERDELQHLHRQLKEVTTERARLLADNRRLLRDLKSLQELGSVSLTDFGSGISNALDVARMPATTLPTVNQESPLTEKIGLFRSLFRGRQDVFARLWQSKHSGKVGYSPACNHEWDSILCGKPRIKCGECPNRDFAPVTDAIIQNHLEGKHTIGIYPLLPDETCYLLAVDFDKQSWMEDAAAFLATCHHVGIPAAIERSRSGNGAHVWIFFSEAVSASAARRLGCFLVTETMSHHHQLGMDSYDRLFPNQDTLPKGGLGNLIALPLQKGPGERGNTLFLDRNLSPYQDQWAFLASIGRMESSTLDELVREAVRRGQVIGVRASSTGEEDQPWAMTPSSRLRGSPLVGPFPVRVRVVMGNLIYVEKEGLSSSLLNRIKRLAAFQNPEFYKRQSMRLSTSLTPRVICCAEEFPKHLGIPRGCLDELRELLDSVGITLELVEERFRGKEQEVTFHGELTPAQEAATSDLIRYDNGILVAPAGSGKTVVGIYMIATRGVNTLVLVHRRPLLEQWRAQLANFLKVDPMTVGQIGGGRDRRSGLVDVAMFQSLIRKGHVEDIVAEYGQVIVDECHHLPAVTFEQVLRQVKARYVVGLTATPYRRDGHQAIILMQCGPVRHVISQKDHGSQGMLRHRLICRDTGFVSPSQEGEPPIHNIYAALVADEARNQLILGDLLRALQEGRSPILLTERREHLEFFASRLAKSVRNVVILHGGMGTRQRRAVAEQLAAIPDGEERVLLATGRYIGEGFDDARLDTLFLAMPVSWKGTLVQYAGRLHRLHAGKAEVRIYDYVDQHSPTLLRMFRKRLRGYRAIGYEADNQGSSAGKNA